MPEIITLEEAQAHLAELVARLPLNAEVVITRNEQPVAKLIGQAPATRRPRQPGSAQGKLIIHADDDEHLEDFKEYLP